MHKPIAAVSLCLVLAGGPAAAVAPRDGHNFDPGTAMTGRHEGAPEELDRAAFLLGDWQVELRTHAGDGEPTVAQGRSAITYMNRGHSLMEAFHTPDFDGSGTELSSLGFLSYSPGIEQWSWGEGDSFTESIRIANGDFDGERLVLRDAIRPRGSGRLLWLEYRFEPTASGFRFELAESADAGKSWRTRQTRDYTPAPAAAAAAEPASKFGTPASDQPPEAREFDFLIGLWDSRHDLRLPNGANPKWTSNSTARYVLNGHAVLEFDWFDTDPNLPSAATTILRIYNRAMKRWECLYLPNRSNSPLYFGGRREGDEIVLHLFAHHTADPQVSRYVFHNLGADSFSWYSTVSRDRGRTFDRTWTIEVARKPEPEATGEAP